LKKKSDSTSICKQHKMATKNKENNRIQMRFIHGQAYTDYSDSVARRMGFIPLPLAVLVRKYFTYLATPVILIIIYVFVMLIKVSCC